MHCLLLLKTKFESRCFDSFPRWRVPESLVYSVTAVGSPVEDGLLAAVCVGAEAAFPRIGEKSPAPALSHPVFRSDWVRGSGERS